MAEQKPQGNPPKVNPPQVGRGQTVGPPTGGSRPAATPQGQPGQGRNENPTQSQLNPTDIENDAITEVDSNEPTEGDETDTSVDPGRLPKFPKSLATNQGQGEDMEDTGPTQPGLIVDPKQPAKLKGETDKTRKMTGKGPQEVVPKHVETPPTPPYAPSQNYEGQLPPPSNEMVTNESREGSVEEGMPGLIKTAEVRGTTYVDSAISAKQMQHGIKTTEPVKRERRVKLGRFLVQHPDNPPLTFAAMDRLQAIQLYRQHCGIIASDKETAVTEVN